MPDAKAIDTAADEGLAPESVRPTFVGRRRESAQLRAALRDAMAGRGGLVLLAGEPGIGKTRLADEVTAEAAGRGARIAWGRCWESGGAPAYWPWIQILRSCLRESDSDLVAPPYEVSPLLATLLPELRRSGAGEASPAPALGDLGSVEPQGERFRLFDAVSLLLRGIATRAPLVVVFDDCHAADTASLLLLRFVARDLRQLPVLLVVTHREIETRLKPQVAELIAELGREGTTLALHGLSEADVGELVEDSAGRAPDRVTVEALHHVTEGNPFFLNEIIRLLTAQGQFPPPDGISLATLNIPESVRAAIRQRAGLVSRRTREVATVAAVIGREFDLPVVRAAADLPLEDLAAALDEAETCGIIARCGEAAARYRFLHALIPETLYHDLSKAERRRIHLRIAQTIEALNGANLEPHLAELAHHYWRALPAGPPRKVVEYARRGALGAQALLAYQEAARLFEMALEALELEQPIDEEERCSMLLALGEALYGAGLFNRTRTAFARAADSARSLGGGERLARAALGFGMPPLSPYSVDEALVRLLEESLAALPERDTSLRAMLLARLAAELYWSESRGRGGELSREAVAMARRIGDSSTLIYVLYTRHLAAWSLDNLEERLEIAGEIVRLAAEHKAWATRVWGLRAHYLRFVDLLEVGDIHAVDEEIERYALLARELRQHLGYEELARATRALMSARFEEAERMANQALEVAQRLERRTRAFRQAVNSHLLIVRREQQRLEELRQIFASARRAPRSALARCSLALCLAELGHREEAAAEFEQLASGDFANLPRDTGWMGMMILLAEVCVALHDVERATVLYRLLLPYEGRNATLDVHVCYGSVAHYLGMLATTMSRFDAAERHFDTALRFNLEMGASLWIAHTHHQYARMLLLRDRGDDRERAADLLESTLVTAESQGMTNLAAKLRDLRGAAAAPADVVTIVFTDIEDSTGLNERLGDARAQELIHAHNALIRDHLGRHGGVEVKSMGDGFMLAFADPQRALSCCVEIQRSLAQHFERHPEGAVSVAMGLHTGEAIREKGDYYGRTVILAARIRARARGGEILASSAVRDLAQSCPDVAFDEGRDFELKGFVGAHRLYGVRWRDETPPRG